MKTDTFPSPRTEAKKIRAHARAAISQLLFTRRDGVSFARLRDLLRDAFVACTDPFERAVAALDEFTIVEILIDLNERLFPEGLAVETANGFARMVTRPVHPEGLRAVMEAELETEAGIKADHLSESALEVLTAIAFKQPITMSDLGAWFDADKRSQVHRLLDLGMVEKFRQRNGMVAYGTTNAFEERFGKVSVIQAEMAAIAARVKAETAVVV